MQTTHGRYPPYLSRATSGDSFAAASAIPRSSDEPLRPWKEVRRDFLSDTWKSQQRNEPQPSTRRNMSAPSSRTTATSSFLTLRREDPKFKVTRKLSPSGSQTEDAGSSTPTLTADADSFSTVSERALDDFGVADSDTTVTTAGLGCEPFCLNAHPLLLDPQERCNPVSMMRRPTTRNAELASSSDEESELDVPASRPQSVLVRDSGAKQSLASGSDGGLPYGQHRPPSTDTTCRVVPSAKPTALPTKPSDGLGEGPARLNTNLLSPQTQKTLKGQIVVLPSKSLLVDLREGERRKGGKGKEVLLISPDGDSVGCPSTQ